MSYLILPEFISPYTLAKATNCMLRVYVLCQCARNSLVYAY